MGKQAGLVLWRLHQEDRTFMGDAQAAWMLFEQAGFEFSCTKI